jgi:hypothetical protein
MASSVTAIGLALVTSALTIARSVVLIAALRRDVAEAAEAAAAAALSRSRAARLWARMSRSIPPHGSWLNLIEGLFSKLARSVLRHIRVTSKQESRRGSWLPSTTSTGVPSCALGPTHSTRPPEMIRTKETLV